MARAVQVQTSIDDASRAQAIAAELVDARLAACVQVIGPMTATYRWQGAVESATEHLLLCKTTADQADALVEALAELHPYDVPEVVVLPIEGGLGAYLDWIDDSVT